MFGIFYFSLYMEVELLGLMTILHLFNSYTTIFYTRWHHYHYMKIPIYQVSHKNLIIFILVIPTIDLAK